jgi:hypothetical protein
MQVFVQPAMQSAIESPGTEKLIINFSFVSAYSCLCCLLWHRDLDAYSLRCFPVSFEFPDIPTTSLL